MIKTQKLEIKGSQFDKKHQNNFIANLMVRKLRFHTKNRIKARKPPSTFFKHYFGNISEIRQKILNI